jgi:hypothetical protein
VAIGAGSVPDMPDGDEEWITQAEAREILGLGKATVPKLVARSLLHPRPQRPSLSRSEVLALRDARAKAARLRALPIPERQPRPASQPPDDEHDWVLADVVAAHLGVGVAAVHQRARRGRLPFTLSEDGSTRFYRLELVDMALRGQAASRARTLKPLSSGGGGHRPAGQ